MNSTNVRDKVWRDVTALRRHQKQHNVMAIWEGIRVSVQYRASVLISCEIGTLAPRFLSHILIIYIYSYLIKRRLVLSLWYNADTMLILLKFLILWTVGTWGICMITLFHINRHNQTKSAIFGSSFSLFWPRGYKAFFMLNSTEHENCLAY